MTTLHRTTTATTTTRPSGNRVKGNAPLLLPLLPDPPRKNDMLQTLNFEKPAVMNTVDRHYDALRQEIQVLVAGNGYLCAARRDLPYAPYPDMLIAFGVDAAAIAATNGYVIDEVGKPPGLRPGSGLRQHRPAGLHRQAHPVRPPGRAGILAF